MDGVFSKYWNDKREYDANHKVQMTTPAPAMSPMFNHTILFKTIEDRVNMSDVELRYFIQNNFQSIMNNLFDRSVGVKYIDAFQDVRFLDAFIDVIRNMQYFDPDVTVRCNLLAYHYITTSERFNKKPEVVHRMLEMSKVINRYKLIAIKKFGMPEQLETLLLVARYSDFNLDICVKRVDLMLATSAQIYKILGLSTEYEASSEAVDWMAKLLIELYKPEEWVYVLPYFMLDVIPDADGSPATEWITEEVEAIDSLLNLAVLKVLDTMIDSSVALRGILLSYAEGYRIMNYKRRPRFSFRTISYDYERIRNVMFEMEEENIHIP